MTTATLDIKAMTKDELASMLESLLADKKTTAKVTKTPKVTTVESALPKLEHCNDSYEGIEIPPMDYRPLQAWCKARGIKASGSTSALRQRANDFLSGRPVDMIKKAPKKERKAKAPKRTAFGLRYRTAQKLVSWFKANMPSTYMPELVKNIGWDNVTDNIDALLRTEWFRNMDMSTFKGMAQDCLMTQDEIDAFINEVGE